MYNICMCISTYLHTKFYLRNRLLEIFTITPPLQRLQLGSLRLQQFQDNGNVFPLSLSDSHAQQCSVRYSSSKGTDPIGGTSETVTSTIFSSVVGLHESATFWDRGPEYLEGPELVSNRSTSFPYYFSFRGIDSDCKYRIRLGKLAPFAWYRNSTSSALQLYCYYSVLLLV